MLILNNAMGLFIERVTQLAKRNLQTFWPTTDKIPPLQEPPSCMRPKGCCHGYSETVYFLSVPVCAGAWWRFIVQTHTAPNSQRQLTNGERSPANEPSFHQTFGLSWWRGSPFPHRVNTQRSEFPGTDLESSVPGKTTL